MKPLEERFRRARTTFEIQLQTGRGQMSVGALEQALGWRAARITQLIVTPADAPNRDAVSLGLSRLSLRDVDEVVDSLAKLPGGSNVRRLGAER